MKITVLAENTSCRSDCLSEHGLSMFVEAAGYDLLFDMGQTDMFAVNAATLGLDLRRADGAVLSHGHYDHGGGISRFLQLNDHAKVYVSGYAFEPYYSGTEKYIGIDTSLKDSPRLVPVKESIELAGGISLIPWGEYKPAYPLESYGLNKMENGCLVPDDFRHEQYVMLEENGRRILLSGCSHIGILNIMERFRPDVLVGGFHFMKIPAEGSGREKLLDLASRLMEYDAQYYTCHCTGAEQYEVLSTVMGEKLHYISAGMVAEV